MSGMVKMTQEGANAAFDAAVAKIKAKKEEKMTQNTQNEQQKAPETPKNTEQQASKPQNTAGVEHNSNAQVLQILDFAKDYQGNGDVHKMARKAIQRAKEGQKDAAIDFAADLQEHLAVLSDTQAKSAADTIQMASRDPKVHKEFREILSRMWAGETPLPNASAIDGLIVRGTESKSVILSREALQIMRYNSQFEQFQAQTSPLGQGGNLRPLMLTTPIDQYDYVRDEISELGVNRIVVSGNTLSLPLINNPPGQAQRPAEGASATNSVVPGTTVSKLDTKSERVQVSIPVTRDLLIQTEPGWVDGWITRNVVSLINELQVQSFYRRGLSTATAGTAFTSPAGLVDAQLGLFAAATVSNFNVAGANTTQAALPQLFLDAIARLERAKHGVGMIKMILPTEIALNFARQPITGLGSPPVLQADPNISGAHLFYGAWRTIRSTGTPNDLKKGTSLNCYGAAVLDTRNMFFVQFGGGLEISIIQGDTVNVNADTKTFVGVQRYDHVIGKPSDVLVARDLTVAP